MTCSVCGAEMTEAQRFCPRCGQPRATTLGLQAERRYLTVFFADIADFTSMSEDLDPEEVREITNACLEVMVGLIHRYGGTIDKIIGDAVMALYGAPQAHEDDVERALATTLEMRPAIKAVSDRFADRLKGPLYLHIGVATGLAVAGQVGSLSRSDYTAMGDTVNLAARLESISVDGQILVSENTYRLAEHAFSFKTLEPVRVKGKREPVQIYELQGMRARRRSGRGLRGVETPFVGRDEHLTAVTSALERVKRGRGGLLMIAGPAGVGKSRLLQEARARAGRDGLRWVQAGATNLHHGNALAIWADAMRRLLDVRGPMDTPISISRSRPGTEIVQLNASTNAVASLAQAAGLGMTDKERSGLSRLDDLALRERLFLAVRELLGEHAQRQPLVLVLEDLHWADAASLELLRLVADLTPQVAPLLLIVTFRSDATTVADALPQPEANGGDTCVRLDLEPLTETDSRRLAEAVVGQGPALQPVRDLLVRQAEGNPFYLEEIMRALVEQGALVREESGDWRLARERVEAVVPASLQGLLLDRIDRLPDQTRRLIQLAAVAGREFPAALIEEIAGAGEDVVESALEDLVRDGVLDLGHEPGVLRFNHALLQEAAYSSLLLRHRRVYHRRIAETLEAHPDLWPAGTEQPAQLALHWERAEAWTQAAHWYRRAGDQARRSGAFPDAAAHYERALTAANAAKDPSLARAAYTGLADTLLASAQAEEALTAIEAALALEPPAVDAAALERRRGQALNRMGMQASALEAFNRAAALLGEERPNEPREVRGERATLRMQTAFALLARGQAEAARAAAEEGLRLRPTDGDRIDALRLLGGIDLLTGQYADAVRRFETALAVTSADSDLPRGAALREQLGRALLHMGDVEGGLARLRDALGQYRRLGDRAGVARCLADLGERAWQEGDLAAAAVQLREAMDEAAASDATDIYCRAGLRLGRVLGQQGEWSDAAEVLRRVGADDPDSAGQAALEQVIVDITRGTAREADIRNAITAADLAGRRAELDRARASLAILSRRAGRFYEARDLLRTVLETTENREGEAAIVALVGLAQVAGAEGNKPAAVTVAARALDLARQHGPAATAWYAQRVYGAALSEAGRNEEARTELLAVIAATREAGALPELAAALSALGRVQQALGDGPGAATALQELRAVLDQLQRTEVQPAAV